MLRADMLRAPASVRARPCPLLLAVCALGCALETTGIGSGGEDTSSGGDTSTSSPEIPPVCAPDLRACEGNSVAICTPDGDGWVYVPCAQTCVEGACTSTTPLVVATEVLAPAVVGIAYEATLTAEGGTPPYTFVVDDLPSGLEAAEDGGIAGIAELAGNYVVTATVRDAAGAVADRELSLAVGSEPLTILTPPELGAVDEGLVFERTLLAQGGVPPYGWFVVGGAPPAGMVVDASGVLTGAPTEPGQFTFDVRVVDSAIPPGYDEASFELAVDLRPLDIVATNSIDLLAFEVVTLPLIAVVPGIPVPYSTSLVADGGLKPYAWTEQPIPDAIAWLVTDGGVPDGLELAADGTLAGAVTSTDQVITIDIPLSPISLTGFFFFAEVADSQDPAETEAALFLIPTVPVG
jgi:hypothetical protein